MLSSDVAGPPVVKFVGLGIYAALLLGVCVSDALTRRIPNALVAVIALSGFAFSVATSGLAVGGARAGAGLAVGLGIWLPLYLLRMLGAGDVKLFAAASAWLGAGGALHAAFLTAIFGGLLSLLWLPPVHGWLDSARTRGVPSEVATVCTRRRVPYGVAMSAGLFTVALFPNLLA